MHQEQFQPTKHLPTVYQWSSVKINGLLTVLGQGVFRHRAAWPYKPSMTPGDPCSVNQGPVFPFAVSFSKGFCWIVLWIHIQADKRTGCNLVFCRGDRGFVNSHGELTSYVRVYSQDQRSLRVSRKKYIPNQTKCECSNNLILDLGPLTTGEDVLKHQLQLINYWLKKCSYNLIHDSCVISLPTLQSFIQALLSSSVMSLSVALFSKRSAHSSCFWTAATHWPYNNL